MHECGRVPSIGAEKLAENRSLGAGFLLYIAIHYKLLHSQVTAFLGRVQQNAEVLQGQCGFTTQESIKFGVLKLSHMPKIKTVTGWVNTEF